MTTVKEVLTNSVLPRREAEIILAGPLRRPREYLLAHPESNLSSALRRRFKTLEKKRLAGWPIAYLVGRQEFYGLAFQVNPAVLIPRPETELLVETILDALVERIKKSREKTALNDTVVLDLGTGSGAIIIALAKECKRRFPARFKKILWLASDVSGAALKVARTNAWRLGINKIKFYRGDLLAPIKKFLAGKDLLIAANLPYLTPKQIQASPTIKKEPRLALKAGPDGLKYYRRLLQQLARIKYSSLALLIEIEPGQKKKIMAWAQKYLPQAKIDFKRDLAGKTRMMRLLA